MDIRPPPLATSLAAVPAGAWAVGVSGGADSVALLSLLRRHRPDLSLHVAHLDHQARGEAGAADARFVAGLAARLELPCTVSRRADVEASATVTPPANPPARYRAARLAFFRAVVAARRLSGVLLAHHADDQAETVLQRLLRGSGYSSLAGMAERSEVGGLLVLRPLLGVRRTALRDYLRDEGLVWREDESNASDRYLRNRLRKVLHPRPALTEGLLEVAAACRGLRDWVRAQAPEPGVVLGVEPLLTLPPLLAGELARRWLVARGAPPGEVEEKAVRRLLAMAADAASPPRQHFPGGILVRHRRGEITTL